MTQPLVALQLRSGLGFFGAENVVLEIAKGMRHQAYRPVIGVLAYDHQASITLAESARKHGIQSVVFDCARQLDRNVLVQMRRFISTNRVGVVHPHGYKADVYALAATRGLAVARVATCHPWTETSYSVRARFYTWLDKKLLSRFDHVVAVSHAVKDEILRAKISPQKVSVIANGVDLARFQLEHKRAQLRQRYGLTPEHLVIGAIGRLVPEKGYHLLIEAAAQVRSVLPQAKFVIAGEGPLRAALEKEIVHRGLAEHFRLLGLCENVPEFLSMLEVFVLSSVSEGMPMVILEAMAAGKPIVATSVGEVPEVLPHGECGLIARPSAESLAQTLLQLLSHPPTAQRLARNAYDRACAKFSSEKMAQAYVEIYDRARTARFISRSNQTRDENIAVRVQPQRI